MHKFEFTFLVVREVENKDRYSAITEQGAQIDELYLEKNLFKYCTGSGNMSVRSHESSIKQQEVL